MYEALRSGASGFLLKDAPRHDLISAIKVAAAGNALLAPSVTTRLIDVFARRPPGTLPALASLGRYGMLEMVSLRMKDSACRISP